MADWVNTAIPVASLIAGSVLTMAGQALRDRRIDKREERARKESFQVANFEMHRTAMLEMQEIVEASFRSFLEERARRLAAKDYEFAESHSVADTERDYQVISEAIEQISHFSVDAVNTSREDRSRELKALKAQVHVIENASHKIASVFKAYASLVEKHGPFFTLFTEYIYRLRMCMHRSGNNAVVNYGNDYIDAIYRWADNLSFAPEKELFESVRAARYQIDRALSNALTFGPYNKFGEPEKSPAKKAD